MQLSFMKQDAVDQLKANMKNLYAKYYRYDDNAWIYDELGYDPFEPFLNVDDFQLASIQNRSSGEIDFENCEILYMALRNLSESQATDERLWAGLCNGIFYSYVRNRWDYARMKLKDPKKDAASITLRFFFTSRGRRGSILRNTLAKYWWIGHSTYCDGNWKLLQAIGAEDFSSKVSDIFYSNTFASNPEILKGICKGLQFFRDRNQKILVRDHIRPTMQYLNALGGGILLDSLSSDDISALVKENIGKLLRGEEEPFTSTGMDDAEEEDTQDEFSDEAVNVDYERDKEQQEQGALTVDPNEVLEKPEFVQKGCFVEIERESDHKHLSYEILKGEDKNAPGIVKEMLAKKSCVGDRITLAQGTYRVLDIRWIQIE